MFADVFTRKQIKEKLKEYRLVKNSKEYMIQELKREKAELDKKAQTARQAA